MSGQVDDGAAEPDVVLAAPVISPNSPVAVIAAPLAHQVFDTLRGWIVNGQLQPGYRLRVRDVAAMVGTSVMPVREAIGRLVETGLAIHEPYKGARVRALDAVIHETLALIASSAAHRSPLPTVSTHRTLR